MRDSPAFMQVVPGQPTGCSGHSLAIGLDVGHQGVARVAAHCAVGVPLQGREAVHAQEQILHAARPPLSTQVFPLTP